MTRIYQHDPSTGLLSYRFWPRVRAFGLLSPNESIDALIDRAIDKLPQDAKGFVIEASVTQDVVTVATGFKFADDWTVSVGADFRKEGSPEGHIELIHTWN